MTAGALDPARLHVFCDFDGTITRPDTLEFLTERFGRGHEHYSESGRLLREGKLTLREAIARDIETLRVPFAEAAAALRAHVAIDPGFHPLVAWCAARGIRLSILSAGFHEIVELFLAPGDLPGVEIRANRLEPGSWRCVFRDPSPDGHDKARALRAARRRGYRTVFIGDGYSDRGPARVADLVFARRGRSLLEFCRVRSVPCEAFDTLEEVRRSLEARLRSAA
jgi:HAD superfamily phosphoserine phosphatase-like hydrolase